MDDSNTSNGDFFFVSLKNLHLSLVRPEIGAKELISNLPETPRPYTDGEFGVIDAYKVWRYLYYYSSYKGLYAV